MKLQRIPYIIRLCVNTSFFLTEATISSDKKHIWKYHGSSNYEPVLLNKERKPENLLDFS